MKTKLRTKGSKSNDNRGPVRSLSVSPRIDERMLHHLRVTLESWLLSEQSHQTGLSELPRGKVIPLNREERALEIRWSDSQNRSFWLRRLDDDECPFPGDLAMNIYEQQTRLNLNELPEREKQSFVATLPFGWLLIQSQLWMVVELIDSQLFSSVVAQWGAPPPRLLELLHKRFPESNALDRVGSIGLPELVLRGNSEIANLDSLIRIANRQLQSAIDRTEKKSSPTNTEQLNASGSSAPGKFERKALARKSAVRRYGPLTAMSVALIGIGLSIVPWSPSTTDIVSVDRLDTSGTKGIEKAIRGESNTPIDDAEVSYSQFENHSQDVDLTVPSWNLADNSMEPTDEGVSSQISDAIPSKLELETMDLQEVLRPLQESEPIVHESVEDPQDIASEAIRKTFQLQTSRLIEKFRVDPSRLGKDAKVQIDIQRHQDNEINSMVTLELVGKEQQRIELPSAESEGIKLLLEISSKPGRVWELGFSVWATVSPTEVPTRVDVATCLRALDQIRLWEQQLQQQMAIRREWKANAPSSQRGILSQELRMLENQQKIAEQLRLNWTEIRKQSQEFFDVHRIEITIP